MSETKIASFVVRFVQEADADDGEGAAAAGQLAAPWRGVIRHVQSREEVRFTEMEEALAFMGRYVALGGPAAPKGADPGQKRSRKG